MQNVRYVHLQIGGRKILEHRKVWEEAHGPVPKGYEIHHINGNGQDNRLENLVMLTISEHKLLHSNLRKQGSDVVDPEDPRVKKARSATKLWCSKHPEYFRERRKTHRKDACEASKRWRDTHHEEALLREAKYRKEHPEKRKALISAWMDAHKDERKAYKLARRKIEYAQTNLRNARKRGCSPEELTAYEEKIRIAKEEYAREHT